MVVSLTKLLVEVLLSLTVLRKSIAVIFFAEKIVRSFLQKLLTIFGQKMIAFLHVIGYKFQCFC